MYRVNINTVVLSLFLFQQYYRHKMKYLQSVGVLTLALALVPALKAWPTAPEEEPSVDEEFSFLGRIEFPCGPDIDEVCA